MWELLHKIKDGNTKGNMRPDLFLRKGAKINKWEINEIMIVYSN